ncbi:hypothetical protein NIES2100_79900 (plasmid) [Calothrix sp. NIES-2100]|uniref:hypothetical protein n=1 Tax=Calothrix sp. NIES-2100 TaxID=1954172 RepID=UPI000B614231|nr:hypothetical protein NIES2100_79900 [Calothrix sp. NIES-2100]
MPYTVWGAFDKFRKDTVDLDADITKKARTSRDYLFDQLNILARNHSGFPRLAGDYLSFGSFARKAKIQPLDDIDTLIILKGQGTREVQSPSSSFIHWLEVTDRLSPLFIFANEYGYVNSTKVLNRIKIYLSSVSNYKQAEIKKTMQAVTLNLKSYPWVFDIVPAVPVVNGSGKIVYYLIPDGLGNWIRTDPRIDSKNITDVSVKHPNKFLPTIRLLKYWNFRTHKPRLSSYYFETLVIKVFQNSAQINDFPQAIKYFFDNCPYYLRTSCPDPKGLGPNLDASVDSSTKEKVAKAMSEASTWAGYALMYEAQSKHDEAIYWWQRVFGSQFPSYG